MGQYENSGISKVKIIRFVEEPEPVDPHAALKKAAARLTAALESADIPMRVFFDPAYNDIKICLSVEEAGKLATILEATD